MKRLTKIITPAAVLLFLLTLIATNISSVSAASYPYNPANLISDNLFTNYSSMSVSDIQSFLVSVNSGLSTFKDTEDCSSNPSYMANYYSCGSTVSAAQIIHDAAQAYQISPKVIMATMQKEQTLITTPNPTSSQLDCAMGYNSCGGYSGFFNQIDWGTWQFRTYIETMAGVTSWNGLTWSSGYACPSATSLYSTGLYPGRTVTFYNPGGVAKTITLADSSTAALYCYTPYVGPYSETGYSGSYNFVIAYEEWFGSTTQSILFQVNGKGTYYLDWDGYYYPVPSGDVLQAYGLENIAPRSVSALPSTETRGSVLARTAQFGTDSTFYLVDGGNKYSAPNWTVFGAYGYSANPVDYPSSLAWLLGNGGGLNLLARAPNGAIFLMSSGMKRGFPDSQTYSTLSGPNDSGTVQVYSQQPFTNLTSEYISSMVDGAPMLLDGKFISSSSTPAIYLYDQGKRYLFNPASYAAWGGHYDYSFPQAAINQITDGGNAPILVSASSGSKYLVDHGKKKQFNVSTEAAWGLVDSQFTALSDSALGRLSTSTASTLITPGAGVYYLQSGIRHGIGSTADFGNLGFNWSNVDLVSSSALSLVPQGATLYAPGALLRTPNGAVHLVDANYNDWGVSSGALFSRFGFSWASVRNVGYSALNGYTESALQTLLKNGSNGEYYEIDMGTKHYVDSTTFASTEYNMASWPYSQVDPGVLNVIKSGQQLTRFIRSSSDPTVFYVNNGQRQAISSESEFYSLGGSWPQTMTVSNDFLSEVPRGPAI